MTRGSVVCKLAATLAGVASATIVLIAASIQGGVLPSPLPLFPPDNWWNLDISTAPVDPGSAGVHQLRRRDAGHASRLRRRRLARQRAKLRLSVRRRRRHADRNARCSSSTRTRATASTTRPAPACRSIRFPTRRSRRRTGSRAASPATSISEQQRSPPADRRSRQSNSLRALQRVLRRQPVARRIGRVLRSERERPPAGRLDVGRRGGAGHSAGARPLRRGVRNGRDSARVSRDRAGDERLRLSSLASRRLDGRRAADGRAAAPQGVQGSSRRSRRRCSGFSAR